MLDLEAAGLPEWTEPLTAGRADVASMQRLAAALICHQIALQNEYALCENRMAERKLERRIDDCLRTGMLLASLLKSEAVA